MFDQTLNPRIRDARAKRKISDEGETIEHVTTLLVFEFTSEVAQSMGELPTMLHQGLAEGRLIKATFALGNAAVKAEFGSKKDANRLVLNSETRALSLKLQRAAKEGSTPTAELALQFPTNMPHLEWFINRLEETVPVRLHLLDDQMELV